MLPAGIHVGVEHEELHRAPPQGVPAAFHAEGAIGNLGIAIARADVVVAEHGMERHLRVQQGPVGTQEGGLNPIQMSIGVDVVAGHQHQIHGPAQLHLDHLIGNGPLVGVATAAVGDGQPAQGRLDRGGRQGGAGQTSPSAVDQRNQDQESRDDERAAGQAGGALRLRLGQARGRETRSRRQGCTHIRRRLRFASC